MAKAGGGGAPARGWQTAGGRQREQKTRSERERVPSVFVGGLPQDATENTVRAMFGSFGAVQSVTLKTGPKGGVYGFVNYKQTAAATTAVDAMHGQMVDGERMNVRLQTEQNRLETTRGPTIPGAAKSPQAVKSPGAAKPMPNNAPPAQRSTGKSPQRTCKSPATPDQISFTSAADWPAPAASAAAGVQDAGRRRRRGARGGGQAQAAALAAAAAAMAAATAAATGGDTNGAAEQQRLQSRRASLKECRRGSLKDGSRPPLQIEATGPDWNSVTVGMASPTAWADDDDLPDDEEALTQSVPTTPLTTATAGTANAKSLKTPSFGSPTSRPLPSSTDRSFGDAARAHSQRSDVPPVHPPPHMWQPAYPPPQYWDPLVVPPFAAPAAARVRGRGDRSVGLLWLRPEGSDTLEMTRRQQGAWFRGTAHRVSSVAKGGGPAGHWRHEHGEFLIEVCGGRLVYQEAPPSGFRGEGGRCEAPGGVPPPRGFKAVWCIRLEPPLPLAVPAATLPYSMPPHLGSMQCMPADDGAVADSSDQDVAARIMAASRILSAQCAKTGRDGGAVSAPVPAQS
eukprot:TRINITY_DN9974_c0_g1_i1.p1 TRINITY_DN9974_c0_g1~~TRINITY_DN9974_c0_g1_i1.p1  ORF type:complete len:584 (+),score=182.01 TRINITY_DN9974_c0_g1_i1:51-1754(+)